ncbi:PRC-barrel domain-containing protein [Sphingomonas montanisoli]|uniref:PRC-barrel domain containing protein n=1 Tax=Sphingomonas montanisoli TaxID=2606412 RepID=A0A5D9C2V4_9SPHN|nr:PRC-barrel domain-containing protein [Sphingomonas montanisoli]TZG25773.1 PRC-barrel domain containing protein [Sphingomonas montanisoli]
MIVEEMAGWVAPVATAIAAILTAANLGARVTGWGFVVFLIGSLAWSAVGAATGQTNLLLTNGFLTIVNLIGIWRWLGRQARYEKGGTAAAEASTQRAAPDLRTLSSLIGAKVEDGRGEPLGEAIEALVECDSGQLSYVVIRSGGVGGVGERLRAVPRAQVRLCTDRVEIGLDAAAFDALPDWEPEAPPPRPHTQARRD